MHFPYLEFPMRQWLVAVVFLAAAMPVAIADEKDDAAKKLNGTYDVLEILVGGKADPKKAENAKFEFKDGTIVIHEGNMKKDTARFTLDPSKKPTEIDIMPGMPGKDEKVLGIYEVKESDKGTELTLAFTKGPNEVRPKDFKGEGQRVVVIKLLRKKDK